MQSISKKRRACLVEIATSNRGLVKIGIAFKNIALLPRGLHDSTTLVCPYELFIVSV